MFLAAFKCAGKKGLDLFELAEKMATLSKEHFDSDRYVTAPIPLARMWRNHINSKGIKKTDAADDRYIITTLGMFGFVLQVALGGQEAGFGRYIHPVAA